MASQLRWTSKSVDLLSETLLASASLASVFCLHFLPSHHCDLRPGREPARWKLGDVADVNATRQGYSLCREQEDLEGRSHEGALRQRRVGLGHDECRILSFSLMTSKPQVWRFGTALLEEWRRCGAKRIQAAGHVNHQLRRDWPPFCLGPEAG